MDAALLYSINVEWQHPALDWAMAVASSLPAWIPVFAVCAGLAFWRLGLFRATALLVLIGLTIAAGDGLVARTMKKAFGRPRPHQAVYGLVVRDLAQATPRVLAVFQKPVSKPSKPNPKPQRGASFPSAHVVNVFAVSTVCVSLLGWRWALLYLAAGAVAYSRVYNAAHWPSDILPSIVIGVLCGVFVPRLADRAWGVLGPVFLPRQASEFPSLRLALRAPGTSMADESTTSPTAT